MNQETQEQTEGPDSPPESAAASTRQREPGRPGPGEPGRPRSRRHLNPPDPRHRIRRRPLRPGILHSGDKDYLTLLDALHRETKARDVPLSVAPHQMDPLPAPHSVAGFLTGHPKWWSQKFFGEVARKVDQIAVMSYDTTSPLESLYGGYVAQQTSLARRSPRPPPTC